jgi:hypothetical protein
MCDADTRSHSSHVVERHPVDHKTLQAVLGELSQWRAALPSAIQWSDHLDAPMQAILTAQELYSNSPIFEQAQTLGAANMAFSADFISPSVQPEQLMYIEQPVNLQAALLRTHYYYTLHLIGRPYLFKVLHHPHAASREDMEGAAQCLKAGLLWPIASEPSSRQKRVIPHLFLWTQNLLCVLIFLQLSQRSPLLEVRTEFCGADFSTRAARTTSLYIEWIRDLKDWDPVAQWCWEIVRAIYRLPDD